MQKVHGLGNITLSILLQPQRYADRDGCFDKQLNVLTEEKLLLELWTSCIDSENRQPPLLTQIDSYLLHIEAGLL